MALALSPTDLEHLLLTTPDDTEDAPWMVMGNRQRAAVDDARSSLLLFNEQLDPPLCIESFLPIVTLRPGGHRILQVSPDLMVAHAPNRDRASWDLVVEQVVPELVVEVSSDASLHRDRDEKPAIYGSLRVGEQMVREYVLFAPDRRDGGPVLSGYRRDATGAFVPCGVDPQGGLWSKVLGLAFFVEQGASLRLRDADGRRLPTREEAHREAERRLLAEEAAHRRAATAQRAEEAARRDAEQRVIAEEAARRDAEQRAVAEEAARRDAEQRAEEATAELERLREELRRLREGNP